MKTTRLGLGRKNRRGIALLLVLVMATLLAAVAVSMVANLRLDRSASVNYLDGVSTRSLVPAVVQDVLVSAGVPPANVMQADSTSRNIPAFLALRPNFTGLAYLPPAGAPGTRLNPSDRAGLDTPETLSYLTPAHRANVRGLGSAVWKNLTDSTGAVIARYFAILEDHSGMLDINALIPVPGANPQKRTVVGRDCLRAQDIDATSAFNADKVGALSWGPALTNTTEISRYENAAEIRHFATRVEVASPDTTKGKLFTNFSRNPTATYLDNLTRTQDRLEITKFATVAEGVFRSRMQAMGLSQQLEFPSGLNSSVTFAQDQILWEAFKDYTDGDSDVSNWYVSNEAVAMISELTVPVTVTKTAPTPGTREYKIDADLLVELHFPFVLPEASPSKVFKRDGACTVKVDLRDKYGQTIKGESLALTANNSDEFFSGNPGNLTRFRTSHSALQSVTVSGFTNEIESVHVTIAPTRMRVLQGGNSVDDMRFPGTFNDQPHPTLSFSFGLDPTKPEETQSRAWNAECLDARINRTFEAHLGDLRFLAPVAIPAPWLLTVQGAAPGGTANRINSYTLAVANAYPTFFDDAGPTLNERNLLAFVRDGEVELVGELGNLPCNAMQTIRLISADLARGRAHPVSDHFSATNTYQSVGGYPAVTRGLINPNTTEKEVIKALFYNMPVDFFPENNMNGMVGQEIVPFTDDLALTAIATPITRRKILPPDPPAPPSFPYLTPADVFDNPELYAALRAQTTLFPSELQRESLVRNSIELINTRNQFYQILVYVQSLRFDDSTVPPTPVPVATEKAVAQVWRDAASTRTTGNVAPYPYPYLIHQITYLND